MEIQMEIQMEIIDGNLVANFDPCKFSFKIQFGNYRWKFSWNLDPWKFSFKIQNGNLVWK